MPATYPGHNKAPLTVTVTRGHLSGEEYAERFYRLIVAAVVANAPYDALNAIAVSKCVLLVTAMAPTGRWYSFGTVRKYLTLGTEQVLADTGAMTRVRSVVLIARYPDRITVRIRFRKFSLVDML